VKAALRRGEPVFGSIAVTGWLETPRAFRDAGLDFMLIENEHRTLGIETNQMLVAGARAVGLASIVRVTNAEYHLVARSMDLGADGVVVPRVESPETARQAVSWTKFPPVGKRGFGISGVAKDFEPLSIPEAIEYWNNNSIVVIQVETRQGVEAVEEIASVPGVDAVVIGPADLSISLGIAGQTEHPEFEAAVQRVVTACAKAGIASGMFSGSLDTIGSWMARGMRWFACRSDEEMVIQSAEEIAGRLEEMKGALCL
jgi:2-dehydro-3-deoxyglucarate aldolase/4-hydroxy-2-oxoheptanedioate aldolase